MPQTVKVLQTSDLAPGQGKTVDVDGQSIALFNVDGTFHAIDILAHTRAGRWARAS